MKYSFPVTATKALFIKLGENGQWEADCIKNGELRLGYNHVPHDSCVSGDWPAARRAYPQTADSGAVTRHINQVQQFYEEPNTTLWITFFSDRMWWCFAEQTVLQLNDDSKSRKTLHGWSDKDANGATLLKVRLSGKLTAIQGFQGTICTVRDREYLLHKINGTSEPHVAEAERAVEALIKSIKPIIKNLHPKDLETLADLIFRQCGWQRTGVAGETEKDIDLDLLSPITQERIAVQVKSKATAQTFQDYKEKFSDMRGFSRFYFITHSPNARLSNLATDAVDQNFVLWGPEQLALQAVRTGLVTWLVDKAS